MLFFQMQNRKAILRTQGTQTPEQSVQDMETDTSVKDGTTNETQKPTELEHISKNQTKDHSSGIEIDHCGFPVSRLLTDFVCLLIYEF